MSERAKRKSSQEKKQLLEQLAVSGGRRPPVRDRDKLGVAWRNYTSPKSPSYDADFTEKMRAKRPDWFEKSVDRNKAALLQYARDGKLKHELPQSLQNALRNYSNEKNASYDGSFCAEVKQLNAAWLEKIPRKRSTKPPVQSVHFGL